jgi:hypothetical protein
MKWLWMIVPAAVGGAWWAFLRWLDRGQRNCCWCAAKPGEIHAPGCKTEARR